MSEGADPDAIEQAVRLLEQGQLLGLPTETVYGLAADGLSPEAVRRIFALKGRPPGHPLILHVGEPSWLDDLAVEVPEAARRLAACFWPGPLTLVLRRSAKVPLEVTGGLDTVALRMPAHPVALAVLRAFSRPLAAPSANRFGAVSPTRREHVEADFGAELPLVLEGGPSSVGVESTIVDLCRAPARLLRPGAVTRVELEQVLGAPVLEDDGHGARAPGTLASHYAPRAAVELVPEEALAARAAEFAPGARVGVIASGAPPEDLVPVHRLIVVTGGLGELARELYGALRELDAAGCDVIVTSVPPPEGLGEAVGDRLRRAAAPRSGVDPARR